MTDLTFSYSGAELAPLLEARLAEHEAALKAAADNLARFTPAQIASAQTPALKPTFALDRSGALRTRPAQTSNELAAAMHAQQQAQLAIAETTLWLIECYRTPNTRWQLDLATLARLYPGQTAGETLEALRVKPAAPSSRFGRLAAALAAWRAPRRQLPRLPAQAA